MATVLPPPSKKQKLAAVERARQVPEPEFIPEGNIRVQFVDRVTNAPTGPAVSVSLANSSVKHLELLLNSLNGIDDSGDRIPYQFFFEKRDGDTVSDEALGENGDLYRSLVKPGTASTEELIRLHYAPQAVFRVRAVSRCAAAMPGHGSPILATQFSPASSARMVSGSGDSTARIWDCDTGTAMHTLTGHTGWILAVGWSPDDQWIATGSMDNTVRMWDPKTGKPRGGALKGHTKWITSLSWEPYHRWEKGRPRVASSSKDCTVRIWDCVGGRTDMALSGHKASVSCVKWGGMGFIYTASHDKTVRVWNATNGAVVHTLSAHSHWVNHLALSTDFVLRTGYFDPSKDVPDTDEGKVVAAKQRFVKAATIRNEVVERLVTASDDFTIFLWEPSKSTKPVSRLQGHQKQVNHVSFSPDGLYIASAAFDNHVKLWDARDGRFITTLRGHVGPVYQCCFSADSRLLVSASKDTTLKAWNVRTGKLAEDLPGHQDEVYAVDWSPDGLRVGSGGKDKTVRLWRH